MSFRPIAHLKKLVAGLALLVSLPAQAVPIGPGGLSTLPGVGTDLRPGPEIRVIMPPPTACFFRRTEFRDAYKCYSLGDYPTLPGDMPDRIRSISMWPNTKVVMCTRPNFRGRCTTYISSQPQVSGRISEKFRSMRIMWKI